MPAPTVSNPDKIRTPKILHGALVPAAAGVQPAPRRMYVSTFWTPDKVQRLRTLIGADGRLTVSYHVAAALIGCDRHTLSRFLNNTKLAAPRRNRHQWTAARKAALRRLCHGGVLGVTVSRAAARLGCSYGQLREGLSQIGVNANTKRRPRYQWTPTRIMQLRNLADGGVLRYTLPEVMARLGCSRKVLRRAMASLRLETQPRFAWTPEAEAKLAVLRDAGGTLKVSHDIAAKIIGCSPRTIDYRLQRERSKKV